MLKMEYKGQAVLTTDQIATILGTNPVNIRMNYSNNVTYFEEGKHFFKVTGEELATAKKLLEGATAGSTNRVNGIYPVLRLIEEPDAADVWVPDPTIGKRTNTLTLWTRRGLCCHAKLLTTRPAWKIYERMEDVYFAVLEGNRLEAPKARAKVRYKRWRGKAVLLTSDMLEIIPGSTKDHIRYAVEKFLTRADMTVLEGVQLDQFKLENGLRKTIKSLRVIYDSGVQKICAYYNVTAPEIEETPMEEPEREERLDRMMEAAAFLLQETVTLAHEMKERRAV